MLTAANPRHPRRLQTDNGKDFINSDFQVLMNCHAIPHFANKREQNAAVVKRFNRTIKTRIWTYLSDRGTVRWVNVIQGLVNSYNLSRHCSIAIAPADVQKKRENRLWDASSGTETPTINLKFRSELLSGPEATRQFLIMVIFQTQPRNDLQ